MKNILSDKHPVSLDKGLEAVKEFFDRYDNADKFVSNDNIMIKFLFNQYLLKASSTMC